MKNKQLTDNGNKSDLLTNKGKGNVPARDDWQTPQWLFNKLDKQYGFEIDCCAESHNTKCEVWYNDFLKYDNAFVGEIHWINPPFSKAKEILEHFFTVVKNGVGIYRCDNMETKVWQEIILKKASWVFIPKGRINYEGKKGNGSVFASALFGLNVPEPIGLDGTVLLIAKK